MGPARHTEGTGAVEGDDARASGEGNGASTRVGGDGATGAGAAAALANKGMLLSFCCKLGIKSISSSSKLDGSKGSIPSGSIIWRRRIISVSIESPLSINKSFSSPSEIKDMDSLDISPSFSNSESYESLLPG